MDAMALETAKPVPRTQEDRRAETSKAIVEATIDALVVHGYAAVRTRHIVGRAGVTWGAIQHLFGDKNGLMLEVANHALSDLSIEIQSIREPALDLERRVSMVTQKTWRIYSSSAYIALTEVVRGSRDDVSFNNEVVAAQIEWLDEVAESWARLFEPLGVRRKQIDEARTAVSLMLSGLAARQIFLYINRDELKILKIAKLTARRILEGEL